MNDREKVIKDLGFCVNGHYKVELSLAKKILALLKEQDELLHKKQKDIDRLCNEISEWKHKFHDILLKEQEEIKPKQVGFMGKRTGMGLCACVLIVKRNGWATNQKRIFARIVDRR